MSNEPNTQGAQVNLDGVKGWLLVFCFVLTIATPIGLVGNIFLNISALRSLSENYSQLRTVIQIDILFCIFLVIFSIYTGITLRSKRKNAVTIAKRFLIVIFVYQLLIAIAFDSTKWPVEMTPGIPESILQKTIPVLIAIVSWYIYLNKSERVRITYKLPGKMLAKTSLWDYVKFR